MRNFNFLIQIFLSFFYNFWGSLPVLNCLKQCYDDTKNKKKYHYF